MTAIDDVVTTAELVALTERRRPGVGPRLSWASVHPFVAGPRVPLDAEGHSSWRGMSVHYARQAIVLDATVAALAAASAWLAAGRIAPAGYVAAVVAAVFVVAIGVGHGYDGRVVGDGPRELQAVLRAGLAAVVVPALASAFLHIPFPRIYVGVFAVVATLGVTADRFVLRHGLHRARSHGSAMARTLVVGDAAAVNRTITDLRRASYHGYRVVGVCLPSAQDSAPLDGTPLLGALADIPQVAHDHSIETVIVTGGELAGDALRRLSWALSRAGADLVVAPGLVEVLGPRVSVRPTAGLSLLEVETVAPRQRLIAKAILDRALAIAFLVAAAPVVGVAALAVRMSSPGPAFFRQRRVGVDGRPFTMLKLRSMYSDAEARRETLLAHSDRDGLMFKMHDDPRITPVGRILRRFSIDELPQLWNVARGDMSLVGPRPPLPEEVDGYQDQVFRRLHVRPGLTGLWQVSGRADLSWDESVRLDLRYVDNWSVAMDLHILWKTGRAVLGSSGAY